MQPYRPADVELIAYARVRQLMLKQDWEVRNIADDLVRDLTLEHTDDHEMIAETLRECLRPH